MATVAATAMEKTGLRRRTRAACNSSRMLLRCRAAAECLDRPAGRAERGRTRILRRQYPRPSAFSAAGWLPAGRVEVDHVHAAVTQRVVAHSQHLVGDDVARGAGAGEGEVVGEVVARREAGDVEVEALLRRAGGLVAVAGHQADAGDAARVHVHADVRRAGRGRLLLEGRVLGARE